MYIFYNMAKERPMTHTMDSKDARARFRHILDEVYAGAEVIVERYGKPTAVVVNYAQWQAWKRQRKERLQRIRADMSAGNYITQEELDVELTQRGLV
jgi:prevent-host-death family protein